MKIRETYETYKEKKWTKMFYIILKMKIEKYVFNRKYEENAT